MEVEQDVVCGDIRAAGGGGALSLNRGLQKFFETVCSVMQLVLWLLFVLKRYSPDRI